MAFCKVFFTPLAKQAVTAHASLNRGARPRRRPFQGHAGRRAEEFQHLLAGYVRLYAFLSQVIPFQDAELEKRYAFGRFLLLKLPQREGGEFDLGVDVQLEYYRLSKTGEQSVALAGDPVTLAGPTEIGTGGDQPPGKLLLSTIIAALNERFGTQFTIADQLMFDQDRGSAGGGRKPCPASQGEYHGQLQVRLRTAFIDAILDRRTQNDSIFTRILDDRIRRNGQSRAARQGLRPPADNRVHIGIEGLQ